MHVYILIFNLKIGAEMCIVIRITLEYDVSIMTTHENLAARMRVIQIFRTFNEEKNFPPKSSSSKCIGYAYNSADKGPI